MPMNHSHSCSRSGAASVLAPGQARPYLIGDREIHDDDGAAEDQMEMRGDPRRVVHHRVHAVAHVDEPAEAAEAEHDEGKAGRETAGRSHGSAAIQPNTPRPPRRRPAFSSDGGDGENRQQRRHGDESRSSDWMNFQRWHAAGPSADGACPTGRL
jgi:hypothetical protein